MTNEEAINKQIDVLHASQCKAVEAGFYFDIDLAVTALREQAERDKGCEYCKYPESFPIVILEIDNDDVDEADIRIEFVEPLRFCPICGKRLEAQHEQT